MWVEMPREEITLRLHLVHMRAVEKAVGPYVVSVGTLARMVMLAHIWHLGISPLPYQTWPPTVELGA